MTTTTRERSRGGWLLVLGALAMSATVSLGVPVLALCSTGHWTMALIVCGVGAVGVLCGLVVVAVPKDFYH